MLAIPFQNQTDHSQKTKLLLLGLLWTVLASAFVLRLESWAPDDFYITYRYAQNLALGRGFVFNPPERVYGSTDPGLGLVLAGLHFLTRVPVPWLAAVVFAAALVGALTVLARESHQRGGFRECALGGTLLLASSYTWSNQGAAAALQLCLLVLSAAVSRRHSGSAGLLVGAAVWVRPDAGLAVVALALILLVEEGRLPWRFIGTAVLTMVLGAALAWAYFGAPLPNTLGAKVDMATAAHDAWTGRRFWQRAEIPLSRHFGAHYGVFLAAAILGGVRLAIRGGRAERLLLSFALLSALAYPLLGVPFYSWYIFPSIAGLAMACGSFCSGLGGGLARAFGRSRYIGATITLLAFLVLALPALRSGWRFLWTYSPPAHLQSYRLAANWLQEHSAPHADVAYVEIGVLGYYSQRPILDLMGLVSPWTRPFVARADLRGAFRARPTEFVIFHSRGRMAPIVSDPWFRDNYVVVAEFHEPASRRGDRILRIFRRRKL